MNKSPRYLADAMRQLLMSDAQYAAYQARVRELKRSMPVAEARMIAEREVTAK